MPTRIKIKGTYLHNKSDKAYTVTGFIEDKDSDVLKVTYIARGSTFPFTRREFY